MNVTVQDLLKAGVHFGHRTSKWNPAMDEYIYARREGIHVIDLQQTLSCLEDALDYTKKLVSKGDQVLFVGTKKQAKDITKAAAEKCNMPYVTERWLGGMFSNFSVLKKQIDKLNKLEEQQEKGELEKYTKREQLTISREIERLQKSFGGVKNMDKLPAAVILVDMHADRNALKEAHVKSIPVIAFADTNVDPKDALYPIPANDDGVKSIEVILNAFADMISQFAAPAPKAENAKSGDKKAAKGEAKKPAPKKKETKKEDK
jgi:small subunit ribosomal protein S2